MEKILSFFFLVSRISFPSLNIFLDFFLIRYYFYVSNFGKKILFFFRCTTNTIIVAFAVLVFHQNDFDCYLGFFFGFEQKKKIAF